MSNLLIVMMNKIKIMKKD